MDALIQPFVANPDPQWIDALIRMATNGAPDELRVGAESAADRHCPGEVDE
jgi:hypothetical protein